jgi:hypothetical protein
MFVMTSIFFSRSGGDSSLSPLRHNSASEYNFTSDSEKSDVKVENAVSDNWLKLLIKKKKKMWHVLFRWFSLAVSKQYRGSKLYRCKGVHHNVFFWDPRSHQNYSFLIPPSWCQFVFKTQNILLILSSPQVR